MIEPGGSYSTEIWLSEHEDHGLTSLLQREVWEELTWELEGDTADLAVYVTGRQVTLKGRVRRYPDRVAAERAARRVPRVADVVNLIEVELAPEDRRGDDVIALEVTRVLQWDTVVPAERLAVTVREGHVVVTGEVDWDHQRVAAEEAVTPLQGITGLTNMITVVPKWATGEIKPSVVAALRRARAKGVHVETHGGLVELTGEVETLAERAELEHAVWRVPGVVGVTDSLRVKR